MLNLPDPETKGNVTLCDAYNTIFENENKHNQ